jgi:histidinol-phosphate aminotransferase
MESSPVSRISRRKFTQVLAGTAAAAALPRLMAAPASAAILPDGLPASTIQVNANENPYGPCAAARAAITHSEGVACRYPVGARERMVEAIAHLHGVKPDHVVLGCGSTQILDLCDFAFLRPDRTLVVAEPTFEAVLSYRRNLHSRAVKVPLTADFRHDLDKMASACSDSTGMVYVCNPNNPTGTIVYEKELRSFLGHVPRNTVVLVDEAYVHFVEDSRYSSVDGWIGEYPNLLMTRTFSKVYGMAGMRLGYAVAQPPLIARLRELVSFASANSAVLAAGMASLKDPDVVPRNRRRLNDTKRWLVAEMKKDGRRVIPSEANFMMIHLGRDVTPVGEAFRKRGILVGRKFPPMEKWLRVSIGKPEEMKAFVAALREIVPARSA